MNKTCLILPYVYHNSQANSTGMGTYMKKGYCGENLRVPYGSDTILTATFLARGPSNSQK